jgi:hypothetical protein
MSEETKAAVIEDDGSESTFETTMQEIDKAVDDVAAEHNKAKEESVQKESSDKPEAEAEVKPSEKEDLEVDDSNVGAEEDGGGKAPDVTDAQVERAIKAGMTLADVKKINDPEVLDRLCDRLEATASTKADEKAEADVGDDDFDMPDLDPEEFDENLVAWANAAKNIIKRQNEIIKGMKQGEKLSFFDSQVNALGIEVGDKKAVLNKKYEALLAGYEATGENVTEAEVFQEAAKLVLGDEIKAAREKSDKADLAKRNKLLVNRPSGQNASVHKDPLDEIAEEIDRKFFGKK